MGGVSKIRKTLFAFGLKNDPKKLQKRDPIDPLNRFKTHPKQYMNSIQKYDEKLKPKIPNLGSKMDYFSSVFGS